MICPTCKSQMQFSDAQQAYVCTCGDILPESVKSACVRALDSVAEELDKRGIEKLAEEVDLVSAELAEGAPKPRPLTETFKGLDSAFDELEAVRDSVLHGGRMTLTLAQIEELEQYAEMYGKVVSQIKNEFLRREKVNRKPL